MKLPEPKISAVAVPEELWDFVETINIEYEDCSVSPTCRDYMGRVLITPKLPVEEMSEELKDRIIGRIRSMLQQHGLANNHWPVTYHWR